MEPAIGEDAAETRHSQEHQKHQNKNRDGNLDQSESATTSHGQKLRLNRGITRSADEDTSRSGFQPLWYRIKRLEAASTLVTDPRVQPAVKKSQLTISHPAIDVIGF